MVQFCPKCEKVLRKKKNPDGSLLMECKICNHSEPFVNERASKKRSKALERKILDNRTRVLDETTQVVVLPQTEVECPSCHTMRAYYEQIQTRSADEPPTTFYTCKECGNKWREY